MCCSTSSFIAAPGQSSFLRIVFSITTVTLMTEIAVPRQAVAAAARALAHAGRWQDAAALLDAAAPEDPLLALAAAQVAIESDWFAGTTSAGQRLATATRLAAGLDDAGRWDLAFVGLRHAYRTALMEVRSTRTPASALAGAAAQRLAGELAATAPDAVRVGWAEMYRGLIADNLVAEPDLAPAHYCAALQAGDGDPLLAREALRHLGGHDHDNRNDQLALDRWRRATELGAAAGNVPGTLSQLLLLAVLARATGNEPGAVTLATEIARWATAIGAAGLAAQTTAFIAGEDPTAPPHTGSAEAAPAAAGTAVAAVSGSAASAPTASGSVATLPPMPASAVAGDLPVTAVSFMTAPLATTPRQ
jgi:hypothetical protein